MKKLSAILLVICLICSVLTILVSAASVDDSASGVTDELVLGQNYFKATEEEYGYQFPFTYERDKGSYSFTPESDCVLEAVVHDKEFHEPGASWQFVITGDDLNTTLPAYVEQGQTYTIEAQFTDMTCLFSFETCEQIAPGETKTVEMGNNESLYFIPESDMPVTYYSDFSPEDEDARAEAVIKEDNVEMTGVQSVKSDDNNFMYSFNAKAGHIYIFRNYHYWKSYERDFGQYSVCLENSKGFVIEDGTVTSYSGSDSAVKIPSTYSTDNSEYNDVTKLGDSSFAGNDSLEDVTIPDTVTDIGEKAFFDCPNMHTVEIPESVKNIGDQAFGYVTGGDGDPTPIEGFTIFGYKDSAAQKYAEDNGFTFVRLDDYIEIILPSMTGVKSLHAGECVRFIYSALDDGEVTFRDETSWNFVDIPTTTVTVTDSTGAEIASADDFSHSIIGLPFVAEAGETYTITVNGISFPEPSGENAGYVYERMYFELREVTEAALEQEYTGYSEYDDIDYTDYFDETRFFKFTAPEDGTLSAKLLRKDLIEDGGYAYFDISDSENMSENTRLKTNVTKGHTYYIMSNFQMMSGIFKFTMAESADPDVDNDEGSTEDEATPDSPAPNSGNSGTSGSNSGGSGTVSSGQSTFMLFISMSVMLAAAVVIFFIRKKKA